MTTAERLQECKKLRSAKRYDEAIEIAKYVIAMDERNADGWWNLALAQHSQGKLQEALTSLKTVLKLVPKFSSGWAQYGVVLAANRQADEGLKALSRALQLDPTNDFAARQAARICGEQKDSEGEIHYLHLMETMGKADGNALNSLGIAYWKKKYFGKAIDYYHRSATALESSAPYFNLALVYNHDEVSQDADAIDCLERALRIDPGYENAKKRLAAIKPRLQNLANSVINEGESGLAIEDRYQFYINPFELLGANRDDDLEDYDAKQIQKLRKRLLSEIDLEDGELETEFGLRVDRSRAISLCEELNDDRLKEYHWMVFSEPYLMGFLSRGNVRHFLCLDEYQPLDLLEELDNEWSEFREWLSLPFARQYDLVLTRALQKKRVAMVESLFDGRRWILREHEELCFEGAKRHVEQFLEPLRKASERAKEVKPNLDQLKQLLDDSGLISIINLLPGPFRDQQSEAVSLIRDIAISSFNTHGDTDLSKAILTLSKKFSFKSAALKQRLEEDFKQIEKLIAEERQHEVKLTQGMDKLEITKEGVRQSTKFIAANEVSSIRWGTVITGTQYSQVHQHLLVCKDDYGNETTFSWKSTSDIKQGQELFSSLINAAINYIIPGIIEKLLSKINLGQRAMIGPCTLEKSGISFEKSGWFNSKTVNIPWARVETDMVNGMLIVSDRSSPKVSVEMSIRDTENAVLLHYFQGIFK